VKIVLQQHARRQTLYEQGLGVKAIVSSYPDKG